MTKTTENRRLGMTLLELLLVLGMTTALLSMIWSIMRLYSGHYLTSERKVGRAQLVRSISQMLDDDLASAVQDPIHSLPTSNNSGSFIRHFGLRGDSRSLQIDVVQPSLFAKTATLEENRLAASGQGDSPNPQVPELKTIFYEFVPINAREKADDESNSPLDGDSAEVDLGSEFVGSLQERSATESAFFDDLLEEQNRPLVQKYGLSRYELDFETVEESSQNSLAVGKVANDSVADSAFVGSFSNEERDATFDLNDSPDDPNSQMLNGLNPLQENVRPYLTAAQLAMDSDDGTVWIPEVVDCRFRYFDGQNWLDDWNSIEKNGLPVAIEVSLKMLPLDDVEVLRESPLLLAIPEFGTYDSTDATAANEIDLGSQFVGSLQDGSSENFGGFALNQEFVDSSETFDPFSNDSENSAIGDGSSRLGFDSLTPSASKTVDEIVSELGLSPPITEQVISYLPTTPLARSQMLERRKPVAVGRGNVQANRTPGASGRRNARNGERQYQERTLNERSLNERTARDRQATNRTANERQSGSRQAADRTASGRSANERSAGQRQTRERTAGTRSVRDRVLSAVAEASVEPVSDGSNADSQLVSSPQPTSDAIPLPGLVSPTEIVSDDSARGFAPTNSSAGVAGTVPQSAGTTVLPTQTSKPASSATQGSSQSWIRGKSR